MKQIISQDYLFNNLVHSKIFRTKFLKYLVQVFFVRNHNSFFIYPPSNPTKYLDLVQLSPVLGTAPPRSGSTGSVA